MSLARHLLAPIGIAIALLLSACSLPPTQPSGPAKPFQSLTTVPLPPESTFATLPGWQNDDLRQAWPAFRASCDALARRPGWQKPCTAARDIDDNDVKTIRAFFENHFVLQQVSGPDGARDGLMTGYYEPLLRGARKRGGPYQTPLHRKPDDLLSIELGSVYPELKGMRLRGKLVGRQVVPYPSRAELMASKSLQGKEILWVDDAVDAFFLQVQGSGRVKLADTGETVRVAYADQNGHPYQSIGRYLVDQGEMTLDQASAQRIKAWLAANPRRKQEVLNANPSYVFFTEEKIRDGNQGPRGSLGVPLTARRSVAVDPAYIALGTPVFLSTTHPVTRQPLQTLVMAQDTGSAIKGPVRIDFFWGFGPDAGNVAGKTKQRANIWLLIPKPAN